MTPMFFQLVIDKVLVHQSYATLTVLTIGIAVALIFDATFTFLRRYLCFTPRTGSISASPRALSGIS
jgi:ABC-type bacteriocin/lantibiotic exporter with double-glycine peptidase domain